LSSPEIFPTDPLRPASPSRPLVFTICVLLILAICAIYYQVHAFDYVTFDDSVYVYDNPMVKLGLSFAGLRWAITALYLNWHPLTWLSLMLDIQLFGVQPGPQHLVNVLLHTGSALLLFVGLTRMTRKPGRSALVAAIFAVHPLHVESVAWIAERKDVLSTFFEMLTLLLYFQWTQTPSRRRYLVMALAFACSLMAKPMSVTFPFVLLLLDYWPLGRFESPSFAACKRLLWEKAPLLAMSAVASVLTVMAQRDAGAVASLDTVPFAGRLVNAVVACVRYLQLSVWPSGLAVLYPLDSPSLLRASLSTALLAIFTAAALFWWKRRPYVLVGWLWYLGMLLPVIGIVQVGKQALADRYTYLPLVGFSIAVVWLVADALAGRFLRQAIAAFLSLAALLALSVAAWKQTSHWQDSETLYNHAIAVTTRNAIIEDNLGAFMAMHGRHFEAMIHFEKAIAANPAFEPARSNLGGELIDHGRVDEAWVQLTESLRLNPDQPIARANLGAVYQMRGNLPEARRLLEEAARKIPENAFVHSDLCIVYEKLGTLDDAIAQCREAIRLRPMMGLARFNLARDLATRGNTKEAAEELTRLLALNPSYPGARAALAKLQQ
jgi:protein O-mannosyl-transferase